MVSTFDVGASLTSLACRTPTQSTVCIKQSAVEPQVQSVGLQRLKHNSKNASHTQLCCSPPNAGRIFWDTSCHAHCRVSLDMPDFLGVVITFVTAVVMCYCLPFPVAYYVECHIAFGTSCYTTRLHLMSRVIQYCVSCPVSLGPFFRPCITELPSCISSALRLDGMQCPMSCLRPCIIACLSSVANHRCRLKRFVTPAVTHYDTL